MEARVTKLESQFEKLDGKIDDLRVGVAVLAERINHLPTKEFIYKGIAGLIAAMVAVSVLAPRLQLLFGG